MRYLFGFVCVCALGAVPLVGCGETAGMQVFPCTEQGIRDAIAEGGGPLTFDCDGPTTVTTEAEIVIDNDVILDGEGNLTVHGNGDHRVFSMTTGVTAELRRMTVMRGWAQNGGIEVCPQGGGIYSEGTLMLTDITVSENWGNCGAGIANDGSGTLTLADSTVSGNQAATFGWGNGAGILNEGEMTIINSNISGNTGSHAAGGGIYNAASATLSLINSTVSRNFSGADGPAHGGGVYNLGEMTIVNSTVSENSAMGLFGSSGGGIYSSGRMSLTNSTVSGNEADQATGILNTAGALTMTNTLIDGDCATEGQATTTSNGYNIESPGDTCGFDDATDLVNVTEGQLNLGPLADNGGPTMTHALLPGSVAIDVIPVAMCEVTEDQRNVERPQGPACDVGAFELEP